MDKLIDKYLRMIPRMAEDGGGAGGAEGGGGGKSVTPQEDAGKTPESEAAKQPNPGDGGKDDVAKGKTIAGQAAAEAARVAAEKNAAGDKAAEYVDDPAKTPEENAAAKAEHEKAKPKPEAKPGEEDTPEAIEARAAAYVIEVPEEYKARVDAEVEGEFRSLMAGKKVDQETINAITQLQVKLYERQAATHADTIQKWDKAVKADKELGGPDHDAKMGTVGVALNEFFEPEFTELLDKTGFGNHPQMIRGLYRMGVAMGETSALRQDGQGMGRLPPGDVLFSREGDAK